MTVTQPSEQEDRLLVDPVLSEVVHNYELTVNREMGRTVLNLSGSPIFVGSADFATACLDASGRTLTNIAWSLQMGYAISNTVRAVIRYYGDDIHPGDMIFCNDPYAGGGLHASDVVIVAPVFHGDELVMWVGVSAHVTDVGGAVPGSFSVEPMECYGENIRFTPVKFYEQGRYRDDLVQAFLTNVRLSKRVEIDLKAIIGGNWLGRSRMEALIERHGPDRIRDIHEGLLQQTEQAMRERAALLPDGIYEGASHMEHDGENNKIYTIRVRVIVDGDQMTFDFSGTDAQAPGVLNCTEIGSVGNVLAALGTITAPDIPFNEGLRSAVRIVSPRGTLVNANKPAPISGATVYGSWFGTDAIIEAMNYALSGAEQTAYRRTGPWSPITWSFLHCTNQYGNPWAFIIFTGLAGGAGALPDWDGQPAMSGIQTVDAFTANIEDYEEQSPCLFLNRRFVSDSGGPGRTRGGLALDSLTLVWDTDGWHATTNHNRLTAPSSAPSGGHPGAGSIVKLARDVRSDVEDHWKRGEPLPLERYIAEAERFPTRSTGIIVRVQDGYYVRATGGPGFGDPMDREIEHVEADLRSGAVTPAHAADAYGIVMRPDGETVDAEATAQQRASIREERKARPLTRTVRRGGPGAPNLEATRAGDEPAQRLGLYLEVDADGIYRCVSCTHAFCNETQNWKWYAAFEEAPVSTEVIKTPIEPRPERDLVFRSYACPGCGTQVDTEVALAWEEPRWNYRPLGSLPPPNEEHVI